jgi:hypothetical protein
MADRKRQPSIENWLRQEVVPAIDAMRADPSPSRPITDVLAKFAKFFPRACGEQLKRAYSRKTQADFAKDRNLAGENDDRR